MIEIQGLTKYYGNLAALVDLTLSIRAGDIFGFIGPNGAGKTTTMRILATLLEPSRGTATIDGRSVLRDGKLYGRARLSAFLKSNAQLPPDTFLRKLREDLEKGYAHADYIDDVTAVFMEFSEAGN